MTKRQFFEYCYKKNSPIIIVNNLKELKSVLNIAKKFEIELSRDMLRFYEDTIFKEFKIMEYPLIVEFNIGSKFIESGSEEHAKYLNDNNYIKKESDYRVSKYNDFLYLKELRFCSNKLVYNFFEIFSEKDSSIDNIDIKEQIINYKKQLLDDTN